MTTRPISPHEINQISVATGYSTETVRKCVVGSGRSRLSTRVAVVKAARALGIVLPPSVEDGVPMT